MISNRHVWAMGTLIAALAGSAQGQFSENFDSYAAGSTIAGQGGWAIWCTGGNDAVVSSDFANSGSNSLRLDTAGDIVHEFTGVNAGKWVFTAYTYMPSTALGTGTIDGWINLMDTYCVPFGTFHWATATKFSFLTGLVTAWSGEQLPLTYDAWVEYRVEFDLDPNADTFTEYYDGQVLAANKTWTTNIGAGGLLECQAVDLFSDTIDGFYIDDVALDPVGGCYADCDGDSTLTLFDFLCFTNKFNGGDPYADCDGDSTLTLFDFLCFTNAFNAGC